MLVAGSKWDFCSYNWGENYFGLTFFKEAAVGVKSIEVQDVTFLQSFFPKVRQKFDRAIVAAWWQELAESEENEVKAESLRAFAFEILKNNPQ